MKENMAKLKEWWNALQQREKQMVALGGCAVILFLFYALLWSPYVDDANLLREKIVSNQKLLTWMQAADQSLQSHTQTGAETKKLSSTVMLLGVLQKQTDQAGLSVKTLKQASNDTVDMEFEKINFDKLMRLLIKLSQTYNINIEELSATSQSTDGVVNAMVRLKLRE